MKNIDAYSAVDEIKNEEWWKLVELKKSCLKMALKSTKESADKQVKYAQKYMDFLMGVVNAEVTFADSEQVESSEQDKVLDLKNIPKWIISQVAITALGLCAIKLSSINTAIRDGVIIWTSTDETYSINITEHGNIQAYMLNPFLDQPTFFEVNNIDRINAMLAPYWIDKKDVD